MNITHHIFINYGSVMESVPVTFLKYNIQQNMSVSWIFFLVGFRASKRQPLLLLSLVGNLDSTFWILYEENQSICILTQLPLWIIAWCWRIQSSGYCIIIYITRLEDYTSNYNVMLIVGLSHIYYYRIRVPNFCELAVGTTTDGCCRWWSQLHNSKEYDYI